MFQFTNASLNDMPKESFERMGCRANYNHLMTSCKTSRAEERTEISSNMGEPTISCCTTSSRERKAVKACGTKRIHGIGIPMSDVAGAGVKAVSLAYYVLDTGWKPQMGEVGVSNHRSCQCLPEIWILPLKCCPLDLSCHFA